jgi:hypothetical protein
VPVVDHPRGGSTTGTSTPRVEKTAELGHHRLGFPFHTAMRKADRAVALSLPGCIAGTIALEGGTMAVEGDAVCLDDESLSGPEGVYLVSEHFDVGGRHGQVVLPAESDDPILERRASCHRSPGLFDQAADRMKGSTPRATSADRFDLRHPQ